MCTTVVFVGNYTGLKAFPELVLTFFHKYFSDVF